MYEKIKFLFIANGAINRFCVDKISSELMKEIVTFTNFLINPELRHRLKSIKLGISEHAKCEFCKEPLRFSKHKDVMFNEVCECNAYRNSVYKRPKRAITIERCKETKRIKKESFKAQPLLSLDETRKILTEKTEVLQKFDQYELMAFLKLTMGLKESIHFHSKGLRNSEKVAYMIHDHNCKTCGIDTGFISLKDGFRNYCDTHKYLSGIDTRKKNNLTLARNAIIENELTLITEPTGINDGTFEVECENGHRFELWLRDGQMYKDFSRKCQRCFPKTISGPEFEIKDWLDSQGIEVIQQHVISKQKNGRTTIDLYLPALKLGIEFDGIKWHSFGKSNTSMFDNYLEEDKNIHLKKTKICNELGIQLLHIFSNEWEENQDLWKSMILAKCSIGKRIYARKCIVVDVEENEYKIFCETNHLQGYAKASKKIGLKFEDSLIAIASFSKNRFSNKADFELIRFASKIGTTIVGGFSKLLSHFKRNYNGSILSYANRRWSVGNVYEKNGFTLLNESPPNYWWIDEKMKFHSRQEFQRHKLNDDSDKNESEIMFERGYRRIWDCGNLVYRLV